MLCCRYAIPIVWLPVVGFLTMHCLSLGLTPAYVALIFAAVTSPLATCSRSRRPQCLSARFSHLSRHSRIQHWVPALFNSCFSDPVFVTASTVSPPTCHCVSLGVVASALSSSLTAFTRVLATAPPPFCLARAAVIHDLSISPRQSLACRPSCPLVCSSVRAAASHLLSLAISG